LSPEIQDGDFVVASRIPILFRRLRQGDLVVFRRPAYGRLVKRVERIESGGQIFVAGSGEGSVDSRTFGPIYASDVQGVVVARIKRPKTRL